MTVHGRSLTLADAALPWRAATGATSVLRAAVLVVAGAALTAVSAQIAWFAPWNHAVPYTFQTAAVLLVGTALGARLGLVSMLLYVAVGAAGLGVFADGSSGLATPSGTLSATIGYLGGFIIAGGLVGWLAERGWDRSPLSTIGLMVLGNLVIYGVGIPVLIAVTALDLGTAVKVGALDFVPWDAIKIVAAAGLLPLAWRAVGSRRSDT
ncbi:MAG: biotin transporter BioY [Chloroflexota bacterium]